MASTPAEGTQYGAAKFNLSCAAGSNFFLSEILAYAILHQVLHRVNKLLRNLNSFTIDPKGLSKQREVPACQFMYN